MIKTYEALFLLDAGNPDFEAAAAPVRQVLARVNAEILVFKLWDERRLAYEVKSRKRATYVITYFKIESTKMSELEHDIQLNELILRAQMLDASDMTVEEMNTPTPAETGNSRHWEDRRDDDRGDYRERRYDRGGDRSGDYHRDRRPEAAAPDALATDLDAPEEAQ